MDGITHSGVQNVQLNCNSESSAEADRSSNSQNIQANPSNLESFVTAYSSPPNFNGNSFSNLPSLPSGSSISRFNIPHQSLYVSARSNLSELRQSPYEAQQAWSSTSQPNQHSIRPSREEDEEDDYDTNQDEEASVSIYMDQILHMPPFAPSPRAFSGVGKSTLRQTIISRQSLRIMPQNDRLVDYMEEQLVRWRAPGSSFHADEILNGNHPFQLNKLPTQSPDGTNSRDSQPLLNIATDNTTDGTTDSLVESIARSPFLNPRGQSNLQRDHRVRATFREQNNSNSDIIENLDNLDGDGNDYVIDNDSIQESLNFHTDAQQNSGSASSSIKRKLNEQYSKNPNFLEVQSELMVPTIPNNTIPSARTFEAQPIDRSDIEQLAKNQPQPITQIIFDQNANNERRHYYFDDEEEKDCWTTFVDGWIEMWEECVECCTCQCAADDNIPTRIYAT